MLARGQRGDVRLDVRIDALVDERHAGGVADEAEGGSVGDAGVHGGVPFDGQAEPELRLCAKGPAVSPHLAGADAVHRAERAAERLGRAVAVPHRDAQQVAVSEHVGRGDGHAAAADVLGQRHPGQRREHPAQVVLRRAEAARQAGDVDLVGEVILDELDESVEFCDHGFPFDIKPAGGLDPHPTIAVRFDRRRD